MTKHLPNHDLFEEAKFIAPFISHSFLCEIERPSTSSLEPKPCPFGHPNVVLDSDRDSTLILHEKSCAMDIPSAPTLQTKKEDPAVEHKDFSFESPPVSCSLLEPLEFVSLKTTCFHKNHNHISILVCKLFRRMVVDAFIYHKYCRSRGSIVVLTLQLKHYC
jgi:hypothetical protein